MTITEYENLEGQPMVLIIDEENDKAESMTKAEYDRRQEQAALSTPIVVEHLTEIPTKEAYLATLASELSNPSTPQAGE